MTPTKINPLDAIEVALLDEANRREDIKALHKHIGQLLATLRKERGLSYRKAAESIQCDVSSLNKLEKGKVWQPALLQRAIEFYRSTPET